MADVFLQSRANLSIVETFFCNKFFGVLYRQTVRTPQCDRTKNCYKDKFFLREIFDETRIQALLQHLLY